MSLQVVFKTQLPAKLKVATTPFAVPSKLSRSGLSEVVNHLLGLEPPQPFDFLVDGELLRISLADHLAKRGLSTESVLSLEYLLIPPKPSPSFDLPHDDWVSDIAANLDGYILTASLDGKARLWSDPAGKEELPRQILTLEGHAEGLTAVAWCSHPSAGGAGAAKGEIFALSASKDHTIRAWEMNLEEEKGDCVFRFVGHSDSVASIAVTRDGEKFCSGSWDKSIKIWAAPSLASRDDLPTHSKKKQKAEKTAEPREMKNRGPLTTLIGHSQYVSSVAWGGGNIFSGSYDHTIRVWDVENEIEISTLNGSKAVTSISLAGEGRTIASAHHDRLIRLWDPRASDAAVITTALASHKGWVSDVAFLESSPFHLASSSFDHSVRIWDIRATVAAHTLVAHEDKALCVAWAGKNRLLSGGADGKVRAYSAWKPSA